MDLIVKLSLAGIFLSFAIGLFLTRLEKKIPKGAGNRILLGQPKRYPTEVVNTLNVLFSQHLEVSSAYLAEIYRPLQGEIPHSIIGLELSGDFDLICKEAIAAINGLTEDDSVIDFIQIGSDQISIYMKTQTQPFYARN